MKKSILAVAVLTSFCGVVNADNATLVSRIDLYQIAGTQEANTSSTSSSLMIQQDGGSSANLISLVQGDVSDNYNTITQTGTGNSANVVINATMPGNNIANGQHGSSHDINGVNVGSFADLTQALATTSATTTKNTINVSQIGNNDVATISVLGSNNMVSLTQTTTSAVANVSNDGNYNNLILTQSVAGSIMNLATHGENLVYSIAQ